MNRCPPLNEFPWAHVIETRIFAAKTVEGNCVHATFLDKVLRKTLVDRNILLVVYKIIPIQKVFTEKEAVSESSNKFGRELIKRTVLGSQHAFLHARTQNSLALEVGEQSVADVGQLVACRYMLLFH